MTALLIKFEVFFVALTFRIEQDATSKDTKSDWKIERFYIDSGSLLDLAYLLPSLTFFTYQSTLVNNGPLVNVNEPPRRDRSQSKDFYLLKVDAIVDSSQKPIF